MGVQIAKKEQKLGIRASSTCTLNFDDLKVPAENVIGEEGQGYKIAIEILNEGSACLSIHFRLLIAARQVVLVSQHRCLASPREHSTKRFL